MPENVNARTLLAQLLGDLDEVRAADDADLDVLCGCLVGVGGGRGRGASWLTGATRESPRSRKAERASRARACGATGAPPPPPPPPRTITPPVTHLAQLLHVLEHLRGRDLCVGSIEGGGLVRNAVCGGAGERAAMLGLGGGQAVGGALVVPAFPREREGLRARAGQRINDRRRAWHQWRRRVAPCAAP